MIGNDQSKILISKKAFSAGGVVESPTGIATDQYVHYHDTEDLAQD